MAATLVRLHPVLEVRGGIHVRRAGVVMMIGVGVGIGRLVPTVPGYGDTVSGVRCAGDHRGKCDVRSDGGVFDGCV